MGQLIGAAVQLSIRQLLIFKHYRYRVRGSRDLRLKQLMDTEILRMPGLSIVPLHQQLVLLCFADERQVRKILIGIRHRGFQQDLKVLQHPRDRSSIKQISVVYQCRFHQAFIGLTYLQSQIDVSCLAVALYSTHGQARQFHRFWQSIVQHEHHLKERVAA